jgi:hypothetical protein
MGATGPIGNHAFRVTSISSTLNQLYISYIYILTVRPSLYIVAYVEADSSNLILPTVRTVLAGFQSVAKKTTGHLYDTEVTLKLSDFTCVEMPPRFTEHREVATNCSHFQFLGPLWTFGNGFGRWAVLFFSTGLSPPNSYTWLQFVVASGLQAYEVNWGAPWGTPWHLFLFVPPLEVREKLRTTKSRALHWRGPDFGPLHFYGRPLQAAVRAVFGQERPKGVLPLSQQPHGHSRRGWFGPTLPWKEPKAGLRGLMLDLLSPRLECPGFCRKHTHTNKHISQPPTEQP